VIIDTILKSRQFSLQFHSVLKNNSF